jgi:DNA-binding NtrC family response regulator
MNSSPIYIVDDDRDYDDLIREAFDDLGIRNEVRFFRTAEGVLRQLKSDKEIPFIIISDVNLPGTDGFELREKVLNETSIKDKSIPFIFWSTSASEAQIKKAYNLSVHGFFLKGRNFTDLKNIIREMVNYWSDSLAPQE